MLDNLNWEKIFTRWFNSTADTQLKWFQTRLLHRVLPTNIYLLIIKVIYPPCVLFEVEKLDNQPHILVVPDFTSVCLSVCLRECASECMLCVRVNYSIFPETLFIYFSS